MRVTLKQLEARIELLNRLLDRPLQAYTKWNDGKLKANVGNYHLSEQYGGYQLAEMSNEAGGIRQLLFGRMKGELYSEISALIMGVQLGQERRRT